MVSVEIAEFLEDNSIGTVGANIFYSRLPDQPDNCIAVYDTGGIAPNRYVPIAQPTFQIIIRNKAYATGKAIAESIVALLDRRMNEEIGGTYFYSIFLMGEPAHIGADKKDRDEFSMNFVCKIRR